MCPFCNRPMDEQELHQPGCPAEWGFENNFFPKRPGEIR